MTNAEVITILEAKLERNDNPALTAGIVYALTVLKGGEVKETSIVNLRKHKHGVGCK